MTLVKKLTIEILNLKPVILLEYQNNAKEKNIEDKIPDITNLATKTTLNAKINEVKGEIPNTTNLAVYASFNAKINEVKGEIHNITNLATTSALITIEDGIPSVSNLVKKLTITQKILKLKRKLLIIIMINILLLQNLISSQQNYLI